MHIKTCCPPFLSHFVSTFPLSNASEGLVDYCAEYGDFRTAENSAEVVVADAEVMAGSVGSSDIKSTTSRGNNSSVHMGDVKKHKGAVSTAAGKSTTTGSSGSSGRKGRDHTAKKAERDQAEVDMDEDSITQVLMGLQMRSSSSSSPPSYSFPKTLSASARRRVHEIAERLGRLCVRAECLIVYPTISVV